MPKSRFVELQCLDCRTAYPTQTHSTCEKCGGILSAVYDLEKKFTKPTKASGIWGYREFFPPVNDKDIVSLGEGSTPLVDASRFADSLGKRGGIFCKLEGSNPTGSFKDRLASLGLSLAKSQAKRGVFTASSGNAAASISAYSAHAGLDCLILVREDITLSKITQIAAYGPRILRVRDLYTTKQDLEKALSLTQLALPRWLNHFIWATYNPLLVDSLKTIAYEIVLQQEPMPDWVFVPAAGGDLVFGAYKGFREMKEMGFIEKVPGIVAVQGKGADPLVRSFKRGDEHVRDIKPPAETVAGALRVTFGADHALRAIRESSGFAISVSDSEILNAQREIARLEGIFTEVSSATTLAAIKRALREGKIGKDETAVALLTGSGFKDYQATEAKAIPLAESVEAIPRVIRRFE
jgi:threonine synthase